MTKKSLVDELIEDKDIDQRIIQTFYLKDELSSDIFTKDGNSYKMIEGVRNKLLDVANAFVDYLDVEFFIYDVALVGSLANFNWCDYSDVDLHIFVNFDELGNDNNLKFKTIVKEFFDAKKDNWNRTHNIKIKKYDVELYVQDLSEPFFSSGVYSILNNKWLNEPTQGKQGIDDELILSKGEEYASIIDNLVEKSRFGKDVTPEIDDIKKKLMKFRQGGLESGGEFSYENLTFKLLRRNGYIEKLRTLKRSVVDKKLSINELFDSKGLDYYIDYFHPKKTKEIGYYFYTGKDKNKVEVNFTLLTKNNLLIDFQLEGAWDKNFYGIKTEQNDIYSLYTTIKNICIDVINKLKDKGYIINTLTYDANKRKEKIYKAMVLSVNPNAKFSVNQYGSTVAKLD